jgi:hypothetical protein
MCPIILAISMILLFPLSNSNLAAKQGEKDYYLYEASQSKNLTSHSNFSSPQTNTEFPSIELGNVTNLTNNPNDSVYGQVVASDNKVFIIWEEAVPNASGDNVNYDIFIKRSDDRGNTFENNSQTNISNNFGFSEHPQIAISNSTVYAVWTDNTFGDREILFTRSLDSGATFDSGQKIKNLSNSSGDSYNQEIAAVEDSIYVVWQEKDADGNNSILLRASEDRGNTFGNTITISNGNTVDENSFPKIAAYQNDVYVTWSVVSAASINSQLNPAEHAGVFFSKSSDNGKTFSEPVMQLSADGKDVGESQVAAYNGIVHIVWGGLKPAEVKNLHYTVSNNRGNSFANTIEIKNDSFVNPLNVELAVALQNNANDSESSHPDSNNNLQGEFHNDYSLYVAGEAWSLGNDEIFLLSGIENTNTTNNTIGKNAVINLSNNSGTSECPSISISGNNIFVVWEDSSAGNHEIYFIRGTIKE